MPQDREARVRWRALRSIMAARRFYERAGWIATGQSSRMFAGAECDFVRYERL